MTGRLTRALVVILALVGVGACTATDSAEAAAATVDGQRISVASVEQDLADIGQNEAFLEARSQQGLSFQGSEPGTYDAAVVAELVDRKVTALLVRRELARRGIGPSPDDVNMAREELRRQLVDPESGASLLDGFPARYVDEQARSQAESDVLQAAEGKVALDEPALLAAYDTSAERFRVWCLRWIVSGRDDPEAANRAAAALAAGEDFAQVAQRESADQQSSERGGALGCQSRASLGRLGSRFADTVTALGPGQLSPPTSAEFGTFLVQVTDVQVRPFDEVRDAVRAMVLAPSQEAYEELLQRLRSDAAVTVAPRFGTWERADDDRVGVRPPAGAPTTTTAPGAPPSRPLTGLPGAPGRASP